jgi:hypothetical protein
MCRSVRVAYATSPAPRHARRASARRAADVAGGELGTVATARLAGPAVRCPRCRLVLSPRLPVLTPRHCPRCLVRRRLAVELETFETPPPAETTAPRAGRSGSYGV